MVRCLLARGLRLAPSSGSGSSGARTLSQGFGPGTCRVFDCADVMVLMPSQRRTSGKRFLAVGIGAFVGPLSRMNASMASQRAAVTEGLNGVLAINVTTRTEFCLAYLATSLAPMRLLASVYA